MPFVGSERLKIVDDLARAFHEVSGSGTARFVTLEGPTGWGKTRIVQELYARLAEGQEYWPASLLPSDSEDPLKNRKWLYPKVVEPPGGAEMPWMWWGIQCDRTETGRSRQVITAEVAQLIAHHAALIRRSETKDLAKSALVSVASFATSILVPSVSDLIGIAQTSKELIEVAVHGSRRTGDGPIDADDFERAEVVEETAQLIRMIGNSEVPLLIAIEDAHDADPSLLRLMERVLLNPGKGGVLVVALGWGQEIIRQTRDDEDSDFGSWLTDLEDRVPDLVERLPLERLGKAALAELVREVAPNTRPEVVNALADRADGNPLILTSLLEVGQVKFSIEDGAITLSVEEVLELPYKYRSILQKRWESLDSEVQLALSLAATQGIDFVRELVVSSYDSLGRPLNGDEAIEQARDPIGWVRNLDEHLRFFEVYHYELARDGISNFLGRSKLDAIRRALIDQIQSWESDKETWEELPGATRQLLRILQIKTLASLDTNAADEQRIVAGVERCGELSIELSGLGRSTEVIDAADQLIERARAHSLLSSTDDAAAYGVQWRLRLDVGDFRGARLAAMAWVEALTSALGAEHPETLRAGLLLAGTEGRLGNAEAALEILLDLKSKIDLSETDSWWRVRHEIAVSQANLGLNRDCLATLEELGELGDRLERLPRAHSMAVRAAALAQLGEVDEAVILEEQAYDIMADLEGPGHLVSMSFREGLAVSLSRAGRSTEALSILEGLDLQLAAKVGPLHPIRLNVIGNLGAMRLEKGDLDLAASVLTEAYEGELAVLGPAHRNSIGSFRRCVIVLSRAGRMNEVETLVKRGTARIVRAHTQLDPSSCADLYRASETLWRAGFPEEALELHSFVPDLRAKYLGESSVDHLSAWINQAAYLKRAGRTDEALAIETEWEPRCEEQLGAAHPLSILAKRNRADSLRIQGNRTEAAELVEELLAVEVETLGSDHPQVRRDKTWLEELRGTAD